VRRLSTSCVNHLLKIEGNIRQEGALPNLSTSILSSSTSFSPVVGWALRIHYSPRIQEMSLCRNQLPPQGHAMSRRGKYILNTLG
jgi:hypothetical protein